MPFESREAGQQYFEGSAEDVEFLTLEDASELAYLRHSELIKLAATSTA